MSTAEPSPAALAEDLLDIIDADQVGLYEFAWRSNTLGVPSPGAAFLQSALDHLLSMRPEAQVRRAVWMAAATEPYDGNPAALPPDAWNDIGEDGAYLVVALPPFPEDGLMYQRSRASAEARGIHELFVATETTEYLRQIEGIHGLLSDAELDDADALSRALAAFSRMKEQMATSRDEFYLRHSDRDQRLKYNKWFAESMARLEEHLRAQE